MGDSLAIEKKSHRSRVLALSLAESIHQLLEFRTPLDLEEDLIVVVSDLDVQVLDCWRRITSCTVLFLICHGSMCGIECVSGGCSVAKCSGYNCGVRKELKMWYGMRLRGDNADLNTFLRSDGTRFTWRLQGRDF